MKLKLGVALLALVTAVIPSSLSAENVQAQAAAKRDAARTYANLPLHFEPAVEQGRFLARSGKYSVLIAAGESVIAISDGIAGSTRILRFGFEHANSAAQIEGIEPLPGVTNYYVGQDKNKWRLGVRNFAKLRTRDAYPGVDVVYYGDNRHMEFDFVVAPMANPNAIALTLSGMDKLYVDADGDLVAEVGDLPIHFAKPYAYQKVDGLARRVSVEYTLTAPDRAELKLGDYDKNLALVIDPSLSYSTYLGGSQADTANGIAVDASGYAYVTGQTCSLGLDTPDPVPFPGVAAGAFRGVLGACDAYVTKLSNDNTGTVLYTTILAGQAPYPLNGFAVGNGITLDNLSLNPAPVGPGTTPYSPARPNIYVVGTTSFRDFPIIGYTAPAPTITISGQTAPATSSMPTQYNGGDSDVFIAILDSSDGSLVRTNYLGGNLADTGYGIAVDPQQNVIVSGSTNSFNFPAYNGFEPITESYVGFITKLDFGLHIAQPILPGSSPMTPRWPSSSDQLAACPIGEPCPPSPDPTQAYFFFSAVYGGQLVAPPATWPTAGGTYPAIPSTVPPGYVYTEVPPYAITVGTPSLVNQPFACSGSIAPQVLVALSAGPPISGTWTPQTAQGLDWLPICQSIKPGATVADLGGFNWLIIGPSGIAPIYATTEAYGVALDPGGDVFAVGGSSTTELEPSLPGPTYSAGSYDWLPQADTHYLGSGAWIIKLLGPDSYTGSRDSGTPVYVIALETTPTSDGGAGVAQNVDAARGVAVDGSGRAYVVGTATGTVYPQSTPARSVAGGWDAFVLRVNTAGSGIDYSRYLGGSKNDQGLAVAVDAGGWAYVAGSTESTDIPVINAVIDGAGNTLNQLRGTQNAFLAKITPDGTAAIMSAYLGGSGIDQANAIALSPSENGDFYVAGTTTSSNFPIVPLVASGSTPVPGKSANAGNGDAFISMVSGASFPLAAVSPTSLLFANVAVNSSSASTTPPTNLTVTLQNTGQATLHLVSPGITITGDFYVAQNNCGNPPNATLGVGASCTIVVAFTPTAVGTRSGTLSITDDSTNTPQTVELQGTGVPVANSISPTSEALTFPSTDLGSSSAAQTVTITNTDPSQTLIFSSILACSSSVCTGATDFSVSSNSCTANLTPGQYCAVGVTFTPTVAGARTGILIINGNGASFPATITLTGTGNGTSGGGSSTSPTFTLTPPTATMAITAGTPTPVSVVLTAVNGFSQNVTLTCKGAGGASCSPGTVTTFVNANAAPTITFTVSVGGGSGINVTELMRPGRLLACLLPFGTIGLVLAGRRKRWLLLLGLALCLALGMAACGGGGSSSSSTAPPQVTVTATPQDGTTPAQSVTYYLNTTS